MCPECVSDKIFLNGHRKLSNGQSTQRFKCCICEARFSENYIRFRSTINPSIHYALREVEESEKMNSTTEIKPLRMM